ncbi:MAG: hypothetical protein DRJ65_19550 [Acidobacteria bacterium]|nr:MAG: hypothetical protein DRJ65_19550 [Acidobacteriota bacterium]
MGLASFQRMRARQVEPPVSEIDRLPGQKPVEPPEADPTEDRAYTAMSVNKLRHIAGKRELPWRGEKKVALVEMLEQADAKE